MAEVILVKETLSERKISSGRQLIARLDSEGVPVFAAYWRYSYETNSWRFDVVSSEVDRRGDLEVYKTIHKVASHLDCFLDIQLAGLKQRFFKQMLEAVRTKKPLLDVDLSPLVVGDDLVDLFIYRFPPTITPRKGSNHA
jgi:hypothetical protein